MKIFCLLFTAYCLLFLSSCVSIEKRKYMDGYHVEWNSKNKNDFLPSAQRKQKEPQRDSVSAPFANVSAPSAVNNISEKNILIESKPIQFNNIVFSNDTLKKKEKHKKKHDAPQKFDEEKDISKMEKQYNPYGVIGFVLACLSYGLLLYIPLLSIILASASMIFCIIALIQIRRKTNKNRIMEGAELPTIGLVASSVLLFIFLFIYIILLIDPHFWH